MKIRWMLVTTCTETLQTLSYKEVWFVEGMYLVVDIDDVFDLNRQDRRGGA